MTRPRSVSGLPAASFAGGAALACVCLCACGGGGRSGRAGLDMAISGLRVPATAAAGDTIQVSATVENRGTIPGSPLVTFVLSVVPEVKATDTMLTLSLPDFILDPGGSLAVETDVPLPANLASGRYYLGAVAPPADAEVAPLDNAMSAPIQIAGTACTPDTYEPDDAQGSGHVAQLLVSERHNFCDDAQDWLVLEAAAGQTFTFSVTDRQAEANVVLAVLDPAGQVLFDSLHVPAGTEVPRWQAPAAGRYDLVAAAWAGLSGSGADTGYTLIVGDVRPDIIMDFASAPPAQTNAGDLLSISAGLDFTDQAMLGAFDVGVFLSAGAAVTARDRRVGTHAATGPADFAAGPVSFPVALPVDLTPGTYNLGVIADPGDAVRELNEGNNASPPLAITVAALSCTPDAFEPDDLRADARMLAPGQAQTRNLCDDRSDWIAFDAQAGADHRFYVDQGVVALDPHVNIEVHDPAGAKLGATQTASFAWVAPGAGRYLLHVIEDRYGQIARTDKPYSVTLLSSRADLAASRLDPGSGLNSGGGFGTVNVEIQNLGGEQAVSFRSVLLLSKDATVTLADTMIGNAVTTTLGWKSDIERHIGYSYTVQLDASVTPGSYYLGWLVDSENAISETTEANNLMVVPVTVR